MVYDPPLQVNINENPILEYLINGDAQEADFTITYTAKDGEHSWTALANPELGHINTKGDPDNGVPAVTDGHADAGTPLGGFDADCNVSEKMGTVDFGAYLAERDRIPEDGIITISKVSYQTMGNNVNDTQESRTGGTNVWSIPALCSGQRRICQPDPRVAGGDSSADSGSGDSSGRIGRWKMES